MLPQQIAADPNYTTNRVIVLGNIALLIFGIAQYLIFQAVPIRNPTQVGGFGLDAAAVGILQLPFSIVIIILGPIAGIIATRYGASKLLVPAAGILVLAFLSLMLFHSTPQVVAINLTVFGIGSALFVTQIFIPKTVMGTSSDTRIQQSSNLFLIPYILK
jgi:MFS family permease